MGIPFWTPYHGMPTTKGPICRNMSGTTGPGSGSILPRYLQTNCTAAGRTGNGSRNGTSGWRQTPGQASGKGSGRPRKAGGTESDRRQIWAGQERLWDEPDQGQAQDDKPIMDRLHHPGARPGHIGRGGTAVPGFFNMERRWKTGNAPFYSNGKYT